MSSRGPRSLTPLTPLTPMTPPPSARSVSWRRCERSLRGWAWLLGWLGWLGLTGVETRAWEGHDWARWRQVSTWKKPNLHTPQAGHSNLVALLTADSNTTPSPADWVKARAQILETIQQVLGTPTDLHPLPVEVQTLESQEFPGYTRQHLRIRCEADDWIPAYLLVPRRPLAARAPAMLCLHQTVAQGKEEPCGIRGDPELAFAVELAERGYVCLAPDAIGFGERIAAGKQPYDNSLAFYRRHPNWSFMGKMAWDVRRLVDYLQSLPNVDPERLGTIGHSHGAYGTLFAAALEPRLTAAIASCGFTTFRQDPNPERWSHLTALIPQLGEYLPDVTSVPFDWQHVLALVAPRPLFVWYTTRDAIFPRTENLAEVLADVKSVYRLQGRENAIAWESAAEAHRFPKERRAAAYRWLAETWAPTTLPAKTASAFLPSSLVARARTNALESTWAAGVRDTLVAAAKPWRDRSDDELWELMFGNTLKRAWQVWSDGFCPACKKPVPMYEWVPAALATPWKMQCPHCRELFPKNDFEKFYRSGLDEHHVFDPRRADRTLLFNTEHPDPADPLRGFGVDDGDGYVAEGKRWRFVNAYLIYGQWKQGLVDGVRHLAGAYVATGDSVYAHKAGILLDRIADLYPTFDFGKEGVMYEGPPRSGYVSTWHDACFEVIELALGYDAIFEGLPADAELLRFLAAKAARYQLPNAKRSFADVQRNIEERLFRDTLANRPKIESNYPNTDKTLLILRTVLDWPGNRATVLALLDEIIVRSSAVDGLTGEKGLAGYSLIAPRDVADLLGRYARVDPEFLREALRRHPQLHAMYRFHLDTWCLGLYYPRSGDTGAFGVRDTQYVGVPFSTSPGIQPSSFALLGSLAEATGDADFVRALYRANGSSTNHLPYDLFAERPAEFQARVAAKIREVGPEIRLTSLNKTNWGLAILRSGEGPNARAAWLDYDSGERHGHADALTMGLFAQGLDLLPDFGYPPVQYGGWYSPRASWYLNTPSHNTVSVDGRNSVPGLGRTTLWFEGDSFHAVRAAAPALMKVAQFDRLLALVDVSPEDAYVLDIFRVGGGTNHTRFLHGTFGTMASEQLNLTDVAGSAYGEVMRRFRRDPAPSSVWRATWNAADPLHYLPPDTEVHLRFHGLGDSGAVELAESWVAMGMFKGTDDAWIPSVLTRRESAPGDTAPLTSTFAGVFEPFAKRPFLFGVVPSNLIDERGTVHPSSEVGLVVQLNDQRRDFIVARDAAVPAGTPPGLLLTSDLRLLFDGEFALVRVASRRQIERIVFCRGRSLAIGDLRVTSRDPAASFEIDLRNPLQPRVLGEVRALESLTNGGRPLPLP